MNRITPVNGYNLDIKNRHDSSEAHADPDELLTDYQILLAELQQPRDRLKDELFQALNSSREVAKPRR
jgi:type I restriction enzyme M protein